MPAIERFSKPSAPVDWASSPPLNCSLPVGQVDVWRIDLAGSVSTVTAAEAILAASEIERADRFRFDRDRRRYIIGRCALRMLLSRYRPTITPSDWVIGYGEWGKPEVEQLEFAFNLTNCEDWALIAFGRYPLLGVDLERVRSFDDMGPVTEEVFSEREQAAWRALSEENRPWGFFSGWTRKEAFVKAIGQGLSLPLKDFSVDLNALPTRPSHTVDGWDLISFYPQSDFLAAVAADRPIEAVNTFDFHLKAHL